MLGIAAKIVFVRQIQISKEPFSLLAQLMMIHKAKHILKLTKLKIDMVTKI